LRRKLRDIYSYKITWTIQYARTYLSIIIPIKEPLFVWDKRSDFYSIKVRKTIEIGNKVWWCKKLLRCKIKGETFKPINYNLATNNKWCKCKCQCYKIWWWCKDNNPADFNKDHHNNTKINLIINNIKDLLKVVIWCLNKCTNKAMLEMFNNNNKDNKTNKTRITPHNNLDNHLNNTNNNNNNHKIRKLNNK